MTPAQRLRTSLRSAFAGVTWTDLAVALVLSAAAIVESVRGDAPQPELRALIAGVTLLMLVFRRAHPLTSMALVALGLALEAIVIEAPDEIAVLLTVLLSCFSVANFASRRDALVGLGFMALSLTLQISGDPSDSLSNIPSTLLLFVLLPAALGFALRTSRQRVHELEERADELAAEAAIARDEERRRIARELHDVVSHAVTVIAVQSEAGRSVLEKDPPAAGRALEAIGVASRDALAELHAMLALLRSDDSLPAPAHGLDRIAPLIDGARSAGVRVTVDEEGSRRELPAEIDHCAFRLVQEGLTNAIRHTREPRVSVRIEFAAEALVVRVLSEGQPHQSTYGGLGVGLTQLEERVGRLGGTFSWGESTPGTFELVAELPEGDG